VLSEDTLYPWQLEIVKIVKGPAHDRHVHWYWDDGNSGKSAIAKLLKDQYGALMLAERAVDIKHRVAKHIATRKEPPRCVIFNLPRASKNHVDFSGLEDVKDGNIASTKYEGAEHTFPPPHVFVFANYAPDKSKLTKDRWVIKNLDEEIYGDRDKLQQLKAKRKEVAEEQAKIARKERVNKINRRIDEEYQSLDKILNDLKAHSSKA